MSVQRGRILRNALKTAQPESIERAVTVFWAAEPDLAAILRATQRADLEPVVVGHLDRLGLVEDMPAALEKAKAFNATYDPYPAHLEYQRKASLKHGAKYRAKLRAEREGIVLDPGFDKL